MGRSSQRPLSENSATLRRAQHEGSVGGYHLACTRQRHQNAEGGHASGISRHDGLPVGVVVRDLHAAVTRPGHLRAQTLHIGGYDAQSSRHPARGALVDCGHQLAAPAYQAQPSVHARHTGGHKSGVLAKAVLRDRSWLHTVFTQQLVEDETGHENTRLCDRVSLRSSALPVKQLLLSGKAQYLVRCLEIGLSDLAILPHRVLPHSGHLRRLAGKREGDPIGAIPLRLDHQRAGTVLHSHRWCERPRCPNQTDKDCAQV